MSKLFSALAARFRQPRWRHGKLGALLMAILVAVCVLLNVALKSLEDEYGWRRDMSFNGYATTGEQTRAALDALAHDVELYLLYQSGAEDARMLEVLNRYAVLSERVTVRLTDIARDPGVLTRFPGDATKTPQADTVIVNCPDTGRYELLSTDDFAAWGYDIEAGAFALEGLSYEKTLTESIVYVAQDDVPTVGILQGHGELTADELANLVSFLRSNNYASAEVNLLAGDSPDGIDMLLIASPQKDFAEAEVEALSAYAQGGGSFLVTRDFTDPSEGMPNYFSLLRNYGVVPLSGMVVADEADPASYYGDPIYLLPYMQELDMTRPLLASGTDVLLLAGATAFETPGETEESLTVAPVLMSGATSYLRDLTDGSAGVERQPGDPVGAMTLALFAHRMHATTNISRMFAIGNSTLFTDEYLYQRTYVEQFILTLLGELVPQKAISLDIMASTAFRPALRVGSEALGLALIVALPTAIALIGVAVLLPRRRG